MLFNCQIYGAEKCCFVNIDIIIKKIVHCYPYFNVLVTISEIYLHVYILVCCFIYMCMFVKGPRAVFN